MHERAIVMARPPQATQLVLLFHGVGSTAQHLAPVGLAMAQACPGAFVVSIDAPHPSTLGSGREWFSVAGITQQNRPERIALAMPLFLGAVAHWQGLSGIGPSQTVLVGFSQGAIMSLEATQALAEPALAGRVVALAGRFAQPVRRAPAGLRFHLVHGEEDTVMPATASVEGARELQALGGEVTLDLLPGLGHSIDARMLRLATGYVDGDRA